jgi:DMSO/TMAO reductase YedYZ molybdopterin-dependent catalytic subunit
MTSMFWTARPECLASSCRGAALLRPMSARSLPIGCGFNLWTNLARSFAIVVLLALTLSPSTTAQVPAQSPRLTAASASAQTGPSTLLVTGAVAQDLKLTLDDLKKLPRKSVSTKGHDDQMHQYDGVPIGALLAKAGVPQGSALRGKSIALTVVAEGADGYRAVFSLAELDDDFAAETVLIVDSTDGQPLGADQGPLRLIVPGDKRQGRWVRMLKSITVVNLSGTSAN